MISDELRKSARVNRVRVCLLDLVSETWAGHMELTREIPQWLQDELASDGIKLSLDHDWFLGPLED